MVKSTSTFSSRMSVKRGNKWEREKKLEKRRKFRSNLFNFDSSSTVKVAMVDWEKDVNMGFLRIPSSHSECKKSKSVIQASNLRVYLCKTWLQVSTMSLKNCKSIFSTSSSLTFFLTIEASLHDPDPLRQRRVKSEQSEWASLWINEWAKQE